MVFWKLKSFISESLECSYDLIAARNVLIKVAVPSKNVKTLVKMNASYK